MAGNRFPLSPCTAGAGFFNPPATRESIPLHVGWALYCLELKILDPHFAVRFLSDFVFRTVHSFTLLAVSAYTANLAASLSSMSAGSYHRSMDAAIAAGKLKPARARRFTARDAPSERA